jgi:hypothetical protein
MNYRYITCFFFLLIYSFAVYAQTDTVNQPLEDWFNRQSDSEKYLLVKEELIALFESANKRSIPLPILFERLQEGASKNVPPGKLVQALREEVNRLSEIKSMIQDINTVSYKQKQSYFFPFPESFPDPEEKNKQKNKLEDLMHQLSIVNRSGISVETMSTLFILALDQEKPYTHVLLVLHGLIKIPGLNNLDNKEIANLGEALLKSAISPESYGTLSSIFVKGRTYNLNYSIITDIVTQQLQRGGGLVQIEQEIIRRGRRR